MIADEIAKEIIVNNGQLEKWAQCVKIAIK